MESWKLAGKKPMTRVTRPWPHLEVERSNTCRRGGKFRRRTAWRVCFTEYMLTSNRLLVCNNSDVNVQQTCIMPSKQKALNGCSSHLQGAGAYCVHPNTGRTACFTQSYSVHNYSTKKKQKQTIRIYRVLKQPKAKMISYFENFARSPKQLLN